MTKMKVLLLEDEPDLMSLLSESMEFIGLDVIGCSAVNEARELLGQQSFSALVVDWHLRGETAEGLLAPTGVKADASLDSKSQAPAVMPKVVLVITGYGDTPEFLEGPFSHYPILPKPFEVSQVGLMVQQMINSANAAH